MPELRPYVCLECRRSFKQAAGFAPPKERSCPICGEPAVGVHPNFKVPRETNREQWDKVRYLIKHGFRFSPVYDAENDKPVPYPKTMTEAPSWVTRWKMLPVTRGGPIA